MEIDTLRFGKIQIDEESVIRFANGLPGFEQYERYALLTPDPDVPLSYLQSMDDGHISFMVIEPFLSLPSYEFKLQDHIKQELQLYEEQDVLILSIVTVKEELVKSTVNLKAPLVINTKRRLGKQIILHDEDYSTRHPLFPAKAASTASAGGG